MRFLLSLSLLTGFLLGSVPARAQDAPLPVIKLKVGQIYSLQLDWVLARVVCDDPVVNIEDGGDHLHVVGVAPGETKCGFWRDIGAPLPNKVYQIVVTPASSPRR
jgi:hypothetical protein